MGFSGSSAGKESACSARDPGSIPGSGRSPGEGIGYPLQCSWGSLVAQLVQNLPAMWETWVQSLGWEDAPEKGKATHSSIFAWKIPMDRGTWGLQSIGSQRVRHVVCVRHCSTFTMQREIKCVLPDEMYRLVVFTCKQTIDCCRYFARCVDKIKSEHREACGKGLSQENLPRGKKCCSHQEFTSPLFSY